MRFISILVAFALCSSHAAAGSFGERGVRLQAGAEAYHNTLMRNKDVGARPRVGLDYELLHGLVFLGEGTSYRIAFGPADIERAEVSLGLGYRLLEERLVLGLVYDFVSTDYERFSSSSSGGYGARARYYFPLGEGGFSLVAQFAYDYQNSVSLHRDTGVPQTDSAFANALCSIFSFGLSNGCGNIFEYTSFPSANQYAAGVSLAYTF